jgi:hypothetical protein
MTLHAMVIWDGTIALPTQAPRCETIRSVFDLGGRSRLELEQFFLTAVAFEGKELMDEHDDDLDSEVHEHAEQETDTFPNTGDELDELVDDGDEGEDGNLDEDESEL